MYPLGVVQMPLLNYSFFFFFFSNVLHGAHLNIQVQGFLLSVSKFLMNLACLDKIGDSHSQSTNMWSLSMFQIFKILFSLYHVHIPLLKGMWFWVCVWFTNYVQSRLRIMAKCKMNGNMWTKFKQENGIIKQANIQGGMFPVYLLWE